VTRLTLYISDRVEVEYKWILPVDPEQSRLAHYPKPSANARPIVRTVGAPASKMSRKAPDDVSPDEEETFHDDPQYRWGDYVCGTPPNNAEQSKVSFSAEDTLWHYLGELSTEWKAQYTEDPKKRVNNLKSSFRPYRSAPVKKVRPLPPYMGLKDGKPYEYRPKIHQIVGKGSSNHVPRPKEGPLAGVAAFPVPPNRHSVPVTHTDEWNRAWTQKQQDQQRPNTVDVDAVLQAAYREAPRLQPPQNAQVPSGQTWYQAELARLGAYKPKPSQFSNHSEGLNQRPQAQSGTIRKPSVTSGQDTWPIQPQPHQQVSQHKGGSSHRVSATSRGQYEASFGHTNSGYNSPWATAPQPSTSMPSNPRQLQPTRSQLYQPPSTSPTGVTAQPSYRAQEYAPDLSHAHPLTPTNPSSPYSAYQLQQQLGVASTQQQYQQQIQAHQGSPRYQVPPHHPHLPPPPHSRQQHSSSPQQRHYLPVPQASHHQAYSDQLAADEYSTMYQHQFRPQQVHAQTQTHAQDAATAGHPLTRLR
jgi:hypothetical protein